MAAEVSFCFIRDRFFLSCAAAEVKSYLSQSWWFFNFLEIINLTERAMVLVAVDIPLRHWIYECFGLINSNNNNI